MGFTQRSPASGEKKKKPRKKYIRLYKRWTRLRLEIPKRIRFNPRSPLKGIRKLRPKSTKVTSTHVVEFYKSSKTKGSPSRPSNETKFSESYWTSASSYGGVSRGTWMVLDSQRLVNTRYTTPGFASQSKRSLKSLPYDMTLQKWHFGRLKVTDSLTYSGGGSSSSSDFPATGIGNPPFPAYLHRLSEADAILRTKALLKVKDVKVNLAQAFGERKQTVSLIASSATRLANSFRKLRRFDVTGAADALGVSLHPRKRMRLEAKARASKDGFSFAANSWLEYKFGWLPLLSDVRGAAEALAKFHREDYSVGTVNAATEIKLNPVWTRVPYGSTGSMTDSSSGDIKAKIKLRFKTSVGIFGNTPNMGLSDPHVLVWELLPYSFVVDWFLPVGDYLSALTATQGVSFLDGSITYWTRRVASRTVSDVYDNGNPFFHQVVVTNGDCWTEHMHHLREALVDFPLPILPTWKDPLSLDHAVTALALLKQTFRVR
nr:MAG: putative maturation protein [StochSRVP_11 levi-like virus]